MDGDIFAVKTENAAAAGELSGVAGIYDWSGTQGGVLKDSFKYERRGTHPIARLLMQAISVVAAVSGTCGAVYLGHFYLTPSQAIGQLLPDFVALLVFFLVARLL